MAADSTFIVLTHKVSGKVNKIPKIKYDKMNKMALFGDEYDVKTDEPTYKKELSKKLEQTISKENIENTKETTNLLINDKSK